MARSDARTRARDDSIAGGLSTVFGQIIAFIVALGLGLGAVLVFLVASLHPAQQRFRHADDALESAHAAMIDQETGLRGYLLTGQDEFLAPYRAGLESLAREDAALGREIGSDSELAPLLLDMRLAEQAWSSEWASVAAGSGGPGQADQAAFLQRGKVLFDAYRDSEESLQDRLRGRREALFEKQGWLMLTSLVLTVVLGSGLLLVVVRQRRRLDRGLTGPVNDILRVTDDVVAGRLEAELVPSGPHELRRIGEGINQMRASLGASLDRSRAAHERIETQAGQLSAILSMSREISGSLNLRYVLRSVADVAGQVSGFPRVVIWLYDGDSTALDAAYDSGRREGLPPLDARVELGVGVVGQAVRYGRAATSKAAGEPSVEVDPSQPLSGLAVPLVVGARVSGAIEMTGNDPHRMDEGTLEVLETLATHAAAAIEAARLHSDTAALAHTDGLTGLWNRRRLDADLTMECERAARYQRPMALIMFDVDHFKRLNDTQGHTRGDEVLQQLAEVVQREIRTTDTVYRFGGEEFVVLARETGPGESCDLAERLRRRIEEHFSAHGSAHPVTASFGVGFVPPEAPDPATVLAAADAALYRSKREGRNRVTPSTSELEA